MRYLIATAGLVVLVSSTTVHRQSVLHAGTLQGTTLITGDADSGISDTKVYTHLLDWNSNIANNTASVNGVAFTDAGQTGLNWTISSPNANASNGNTGVTATDGIHDLLEDFRYSANNANTTGSFTGLVPGAVYEARLYYRQWGGTRTHEITFDEQSGTTGVTTINPGAVNEARYLAYQYTAQSDGFVGAQALNLALNQVAPNTGASWHFYGFTNEEVGGPNPVSIPGLFNTGVDASNNPLTPGGAQTDPHWTITSDAGGSFFGPAVVQVNNGAWLGNDATGTVDGSTWISTVNSGATNIPQGNYTFQTTFDLTGLDPSTAQIVGQLAVDNSVTDILLNGNSLGISQGGFGGFQPVFNITSGFQLGTNTLEFLVNNAGGSPNPGGLRVELSGTASMLIVPEPSTAILAALGLLSLGFVGWRRRRR